MSLGALTRLMKGADPLDVLAMSKVRPEETEPAPELPSDPEVFVGNYVYWPHIERMDPNGGPEAVCSLNPMQRDFLKNRSSFRIDDAGQPIPGSDCVMKSRRIRMTSICFGLQLWAALRMPGTRHMAVFQLAKRSVIDEAIGQWLFAMRRLPQAWLDLETGEDAGCLRVANRILFRNGSRVEFMSAGHNRRVASQLGRGARLDSLLLSESRSYAEPEEVWQAAGKAVKSGWIISESTPPTSRDNWHAESWLLTKQGRGEFRKAHFWPWYDDPIKRLAEGSPSFRAMHATEFVETLPPGTIEEEDQIGLDDEQRAFRRQERFCGTSQSRRLARAENPESVDDAFFDNTEFWLDRGAIELARLQCEDPLYIERLGNLHRVKCWVPPGRLDEQLIMFVDTAQKHGQDLSAVRCRTAISRRVVCELHGRALASELCESILWIVDRYAGGVQNTGAYCVGVERNAGSGKDLIELLQRAGMRVGTKGGLYAESIDDRRPGRKGRKRLRPGVYTSAATRSAYLDRIAVAVQGNGFDPITGEVLEVSPTIEFRSASLVDELAALGEVGGKIEATKGHHDDLCIAEGGCLLLCERLGRRTPPAMSSGGSRRASPSHKRTKKKRILPKRSRPG